MSLFIASLAFEEGRGAELLGLDRLGILAGSLLAAAAGYWTLRRTSARAGA
jgi:Na+/H+ antiporter NhaA